VAGTRSLSGHTGVHTVAAWFVPERKNQHVPDSTISMSLIVKGLCHVLVSVAQISCNGFDHRVSATVLALEPQRLATIRTTTGATYEVVQHPSWQVGD